MIGRDVEISVQDKSLNNADESFDCTICRQGIQDHEFAQHQAELCDRCLDQAIHIRCMTADVRREFNDDGFWLCGACDSEVM